MLSFFIAANSQQLCFSFFGYPFWDLFDAQMPATSAFAASLQAPTTPSGGRPSASMSVTAFFLWRWCWWNTMKHLLVSSAVHAQHFKDDFCGKKSHCMRCLRFTIDLCTGFPKRPCPKRSWPLYILFKVFWNAGIHPLVKHFPVDVYVSVCRVDGCAALPAWCARCERNSGDEWTANHFLWAMGSNTQCYGFYVVLVLGNGFSLDPCGDIPYFRSKCAYQSTTEC